MFHPIARTHEGTQREQRDGRTQHARPRVQPPATHRLQRDDGKDTENEDGSFTENGRRHDHPHPS